MNEPQDNHSADVRSALADALDAGLAAAFGRPAEGPRSCLEASQRPMVLKEAKGESAHVVKPKSDAMPAPDQAGDRYQLFGEIARGGMGAVLRGRDVDLGRDLAVKVLLDKHAHRPEVVQRFLEEAQIGGQLQHPGVVPVYDLGRFGARPFFTMKLVKGQTLAAMLGAREQPTEDRPRLLGIASQVCQAMAYAHAKGVIHRDLKPSNVMVGAFGEVQVMDWGLAKVLPEGGVADEERAARQHPHEDAPIRTARSGGTAGPHGTETEAGSLLGTPAYMSPEQAQGDVAHLDRRADVFGLGAILCEVLTGKPPYVGHSFEEVRHKAATGDLADATAWLDGCGADPELIALTKQCLSPEAINRPKDAQAVAAGLSAYLNGVQERLQAAERERAVAVAREAEQRKRRKVQLALAAAVVGLLLGGGVFAWWRNEQAQAGRQREARNVEAVAALLGQGEEALQAGDASKAHVALEAARKRSAEGGTQELAERLGRLDADLALLRDLDAVDQFRWTWAEDQLPDPAVMATRTREALRQSGADPDAGSVDKAAARVSASAVRERIVSALDRLLWQEQTAGVRTLLKRVDADSYRDAVRDAVLAADRAKVVELAKQDAALEQPPGFVAFLGEYQAIQVERRRQLLEAAVSRRPGDLTLLMTLGTTYPMDQKGGANEQLRWFQAAIAAAPGNAAAHSNLGAALSRKGQLDEAIAYYQKAITLDPKLAATHHNLGEALWRKGRVDEAIASYEKAIALDPKLATAHTNLGAALRHKGQVDEAIAHYHQAIALDPKSAAAHHNLGEALRRKGQVDDAIAYLRKAIALDSKLAGAHNSLGAALAGKKGDVDEAIACFQKAIALDPNLALAHLNLGIAFRGKGQVDEAILCLQKAAALDPKLDLAHTHLGLALASKGRVDEAIVCFQKVIALEPKSARAHYYLGEAQRRKGEVDEAITCFQKAVELDPMYVQAHNNLGQALAYKGRVDEAVACHQKAIDLDSKFAEAHSGLGYALAQQGQFAESLAAYKRGHELGSKQPGWRYPSAEWVRKAEEKAALEVKLPAFLKGEFQPGDQMERLGLAGVCQGKKLPHTATGLYAAAFAADPKLADNLGAAHRYLAACCAALAAAGQGEDSAQLDDPERTRLRKQALDWLRADLALRIRQLESDKPTDRAAAQQALRYWQTDGDLASIREQTALAKLSAPEQKAFAQLWADVAALQKAEQKKQ